MAALIKAGVMAESLQLLLKTTIHDVGNEGTETKICWRCYIKDCKNRDLLQAVERIKFLLKDLRLLQGRSTLQQIAHELNRTAK